MSPSRADLQRLVCLPNRDWAKAGLFKPILRDFFLADFDNVEATANDESNTRFILLIFIGIGTIGAITVDPPNTVWSISASEKAIKRKCEGITVSERIRLRVSRSKVYVRIRTDTGNDNMRRCFNVRSPDGRRELLEYILRPESFEREQRRHLSLLQSHEDFGVKSSRRGRFNESMARRTQKKIDAMVEKMAGRIGGMDIGGGSGASKEVVVEQEMEMEMEADAEAEVEVDVEALLDDVSMEE